MDAAEVDQFALVATSEGTRTALRYAAKNPDRVTHLILCGTAAYNNPTSESNIAKQSSAYLSMIESGWGKATHQKLFSDLFLGVTASPEEAEFLKEMQRCSASQEVATAYFGSLFETETGFEVASKIRVPTLIFHAKDDQITPFQASVDLAAEIPGARLIPLEGDCHWLLMENPSSEDYIKNVEAFLAKRN